MGRTLSEQIISRAAGHQVSAGDLAVVEVGMAMAHDSLGPEVMKVLRDGLKVERVYDPARIALFVDHVAPACNIPTAEGQAALRSFAREQGIERFYDVGAGICHQVMVEEGLVAPGMVVIGSDSHSTAYGAIGAFGTGMGSTDIALAIASGKTWLRVPETVVLEFQGRLPPRVSAKDAILWAIGRLGIDGATYRAIEIHGAEDFSLSSRLTLCGMTTELGAKVGMVPPDEVTRAQFPVPEWLRVEKGAHYAGRLRVDLSRLTPQVAMPPSLDNVLPIGSLPWIEVDQVFLGTCTNGRLEDLEAAAEILDGRRIQPEVRMLVVPASAEVLKEAIATGAMTTLLDAGATIGTPGCGPCIGRHMGVVAAGEVCVSTGNRNFAGRMGSPQAQVFVTSPEVAAASALVGYIADPREVD
jgi:methanogen homoaconitase large subunit